jgi:hypothetical protein
MLLLGAMAATSLGAQNAPAVKQSVTPSSNYLEVADTYDALHSNASSGNGFWMQGGGV